jgi:hypothetical protein
MRRHMYNYIQYNMLFFSSRYFQPGIVHPRFLVEFVLLDPTCMFCRSLFVLLDPTCMFCRSLFVLLDPTCMFCRSLFVLLDPTCMFCRSLFVLFSFFFCPLCCLSFFDLQILIIPLLSSNSSYFQEIAWCMVLSNTLGLLVVYLYFS